jgi:hypothetical protein
MIGLSEREILEVFKQLVNNDIQTGLGISGMGNSQEEQLMKAVTGVILQNDAAITEALKRAGVRVEDAGR